MSEDAADLTADDAKEWLGAWERLAAWWDEAVGEGNDFQRQLIMPATDRLLDVQAGQFVLDAACGNGNYARRIAASGARVFAFDGSAALIDLARRHDAPIEYAVIDAADQNALRTLGESRFDAAVCSMAMMDLPVIAPLLRAVRRALKAGSPFVFSVPHPCFNSCRPRMTAELIQDGPNLRQSFGVQISDYLAARASLSTGILNQPEPHMLVHRPLSVLLGECFAAGFVMDAIEEPAYPAGGGGRKAFSWARRPSIPPAMVIRLR